MLWANFQSGKTTLTVGTAPSSVATSMIERGTTSSSTILISTTTTNQSSMHSTIRHTTSTTNVSEISMKKATTTTNIPYLNVSLELKTENIEFTATTTTTTTTTTNRESDYVVEKTLLVDESKVATTKIYVIVFVVIFTALGCVVVVVAYIRYMKRKRNVVLPTIVYHRNQPVVIPDVSETPVNTHRTRIAELSQNFLPLTVSISSSRFGQQQQQQQQQQEQFQEVKLEDIKFFVPDFSPFPGFDITEFRQILADVRNRARPLIRSSTSQYSDPVAVSQSFPEIDCLN